MTFYNEFIESFLSDKYFLTSIVDDIETKTKNKYKYNIKAFPYKKVISQSYISDKLFNDKNNFDIKDFKKSFLIAIALIEYYVRVYNEYRYKDFSIYYDFRRYYLQPTIDVIYDKYVRNNPNFYVNNPLREAFNTAITNYFRDNLKCKKEFFEETNEFYNFYSIKYNYKYINSYIIKSLIKNDLNTNLREFIENFDSLRNPTTVADLFMNGFTKPDGKHDVYDHFNAFSYDFIMAIHNHAMLMAFTKRAVEELKYDFDKNGTFNKTIILMNAFYISNAEQTRHYIFKAINEFNKSITRTNTLRRKNKTLLAIQESTSTWFDDNVIKFDEIEEEGEVKKHKLLHNPDNNHIAKVVSPFIVMLSKIESIESALFSSYISRVDECTSYLDTDPMRFNIYDNVSFNTEQLRTFSKQLMGKLYNMFNNDLKEAVDAINKIIEDIEKDLPKKYSRIWFVINDMIDDFKYELSKVFGDKCVVGYKGDSNRYTITVKDAPAYHSISGYTSHKFRAYNPYIEKLRYFIDEYANTANKNELLDKFFYKDQLSINHESFSIGEVFDVLDSYDSIKMYYDRLKTKTCVTVSKYFDDDKSGNLVINEDIDNLNFDHNFIDLEFIAENYNKDLTKKITEINKILCTYYDILCCKFDEFNDQVLTLTSSFAYWAEKSMRRLTVLDIDPLFDLNRLLTCNGSIINDIFNKVK